ncbi:MAG: FHA domain-containing protein [Lentimicrobiaceae bacterium]|nr:FHA domain-containing protein [Lentimicrobiaceae bacterium]
MKVIKVGRAADNDKVIDDDVYVSRYHCQLIRHDNGAYEIVDTSTNGSYVNGRKVNHRQTLHHGDIVKIGNICLPWMSYFNSQSTIDPPSESYPSPHIPTPPVVNIPGEININKHEVYSNVAKKGDDFKVSFNRNLGDRMGNTIGSTLGCIVSIIIVMAFIAIIIWWFV